MKILRVPARVDATELDDEAARYVLRVHRSKPGARLVLFDPATAREAEAVLGEGRALRVELVRDAERPLRAATLVQALAKGEKIDQVVRDATELGATELRVFAGERSIGAAKIERWERVALQASRQSGRGDVLRVVVAGSLAGAAALDADARVLLDPDATDALGPILRGARSLAAAIGPEGGFTAEERAVLAGLGYRPARLGSFVMRTETACAAVLGAWQAM